MFFFVFENSDTYLNIEILKDADLIIIYERFALIMNHVLLLIFSETVFVKTEVTIPHP